MPDITATSDSIEQACLKALMAVGIAVPGGDTAFAVFTDEVMRSLDFGHIETILDDNAVEVDSDDDDDFYRAARPIVEAKIKRFFESDLYGAETYRLYRGIRVNCPPDAVVVTGTAENIGTCWSMSEHIDEPDFLAQYGEPGGRDVYMVCEVSHADIDWLRTAYSRINPWISDYAEVNLLPAANPRMISVSDPATCRPTAS